MHNVTNAIPAELYVVEVDGIRKSEHQIFIEALKCGLELKRQYPRSDVKLRDAHDNTQDMGHPVPKRTWGIGRAFADIQAVETTQGLASWRSGWSIITKGGPRASIINKDRRPHTTRPLGEPVIERVAPPFVE